MKLNHHPAKVYPPLYGEDTPFYFDDTPLYFDPTPSPTTQNALSKDPMGGGCELKTPLG